MPDDIQKYNRGDKRDNAPKESIFQVYKNPYAIFFGGIILLGLTTLAAAGFLERRIAIIVLSIFIEVGAINQFFKYRKYLDKAWHRIAMFSCVIFFAVISVHLYLTSSPENPNATKTIPPLKDTSIVKNDSLKGKQNNESKLSNKDQKVYELEHRAKISLIYIKIDTFATGKKLSLTAYFKNFGPTPALHFKSRLAIALHTTPTFHNFLYPKLEGEQSDIELEPSQDVGIDVGSGEPLIETKYNNINDKRLYLYVYGKLTFWDVFHKFHIRTSCVICDPKTGEYYFNSSYNEDKVYEKEQPDDSSKIQAH